MGGSSRSTIVETLSPAASIQAAPSLPLSRLPFNVAPRTTLPAPTLPNYNVSALINAIQGPSLNPSVRSVIDTQLRDPNRSMRLHTLSILLSAFPYPSESFEYVIRSIVSYLSSETDNELKGLAVTILANAARLPHARSSEIANILLSHCVKTSSKKLKVKIMQALHLIASTKDISVLDPLPLPRPAGPSPPSVPQPVLC
eukprot:TRINITY_DN8600_c0_g1_i3.p1 TRINITY_DN8600_c0_g1~~TRINITY_DN8600_c0_g1_i3.p1  ORF type:complete len:211 (-),score=42.70 TRINITY_DN8600_c0_g1_i3:78-677(-)